MLYALAAEAMLNECLLYSPRVLKVCLLLRVEVHAARAPPIPVVLVLYQDEGFKIMRKMCVSCHFCGNRVECSSGEPPCEALKGWLTVSHWEGLGAVSRYNFCSFDCLRSWVDAQIPRVPEVFLESFREDKT